MRDFFESTFIIPLKQLYEHLVSFFPRLMGAAGLIIIGLILAWLLKKLLGKILVTLNFDRFSAQLGGKALLERAKIQRSPSELAALGIYWLVFLNFFMIGMRTLDEPVMTQVFSRFFAYLPNLLVSILILIMGLIVGKFISRSVLIGAVNAQLKSARLLSTGVDVLLMFFTFSLALEQLGIGKATIVAAFSILFGGVVLAMAIAFGLGGREIARDFLEKRFYQPKDSSSAEDKGLPHL
jgi:hypothetical protein